MFDEYLTRWGLTADGEPIVTRSSRLLPVRCGGTPAMLKVAIEAEEKFGGLLMAWWDGRGAAKVLAQDGPALLMERAQGTSLADLARNGRDDEASRIVCATVARLHAPNGDPPELIPLPRWFADLVRLRDPPPGGRRHDILAFCAATARELLATPQDVVVLHGDIHHGNILDFGPRGWLAIDPKRLCGERGFDYANLFCNPDHQMATAPGRLAAQARVVAEAAGLERCRLLQWIVAWAGLSAVWFLGDGATPATPLAVAELAAAELASAEPYVPA